MLESKTIRWPKAIICFAVLVFIFFLQITLIQDVNVWKMKLRQVLSLSEWELTQLSGQITCDRSHEDFDLCIVNGPTLLDPRSSTLSMLGPYNWIQPYFPLKTKPYPRKTDKSAMSLIKEVTLTSAPPKTKCGVTHNSPALVFSAGGYTGNFFHEFNENFIPLFITVNSLFPDQDVVIVITDGDIWWFQKYAKLLSHYSRHPIINANNLITTHCFSSAIVGLIKHGPMIINPKLLPNPKSLLDFHAFLKSAYTKDDTPLYQNPSDILELLNNLSSDKPHLILVSRRGNVSRAIINQDEIIEAAEEIGFNVHVLEPSRNSCLSNTYKLIHRSHAMMGVHGAGLTHSLFLRPGSVLVQVVPLGTNWPSKTYFEKPARVLGLEYMEYKIEANESSLAERYGANSLLVSNPEAYQEGGQWSKKRVYLKEQNMKLDMARFSKCLRKAYKKAKEFMDSESQLVN